MVPAVSTTSALTDKPQRKPRNPPDKQKLIELAESNPNLSTRKLAKIMDCDRATIHRALERFGCRQELVDQYKEYRADILAGLQGRLLAKITAEDIEKAGLRDKVVACGILFDKERLERGQSTVNLAAMFAEASDLDCGAE